MFKLHHDDGRTVAVDLASEDQAREWLPKLARSDVQLSLTAVTLASPHGYQASVIRPVGFDHPSIRMEFVAPDVGQNGGERLTIVAGDTKLVVMCHKGVASMRIAMSRVGHSRRR